MPSGRSDHAYLGTLLSIFALVTFLLAAALASWQDAPQRGVAESREVKLDGWLRLDPYPAITPLPPPLSNSFEMSTEYLLVGPAKRGLIEGLEDLAGHRVSAQGRLIFRDRMTLLETSFDRIEDLGLQPPPHPLPGARSLGEQVFTGELVDLKCFVGAMKPGHGNVHRACASLCIAGELPAAIATRVDGDPRLLLVEPGVLGAAPLAELAGEQVSVRGELLERGRFRWLRLGGVTLAGPEAVKESPPALSSQR